MGSSLRTDAARIAGLPRARKSLAYCTVRLVFVSGIIGERASVFENILLQMGLKGKALHPLGVRCGSGPAGYQHYVDGVNDSVLTHTVGGIGCPTGVVVELADLGVINVSLAEFSSKSNCAAIHCFVCSLHSVS